MMGSVCTKCEQINPPTHPPTHKADTAPQAMPVNLHFTHMHTRIHIYVCVRARTRMVEDEYMQ